MPFHRWSKALNSVSVVRKPPIAMTGAPWLSASSIKAVQIMRPDMGTRSCLGNSSHEVGRAAGRNPLHDGCQRRSPPPAKMLQGIEEQARELFEVCRLRGMPIITFVNKLDREGRNRFDQS